MTERMIDRAEYELQFNGQQFRVMAFERNLVTKVISPRQLGNPSGDLQLALWSASSALGGRWLSLALKVRDK